MWLKNTISVVVHILSVIWLFFLSAFVSYSILNDNISLYTTEQIYVPYKEVVDLKKIVININEGELYNSSGSETTSNTIDISADEYYMFSDDKRKFLISDTDDSYNYGFVTRRKIDGITYLFSHNSYKYTENSGYHIYNNWKEGDIITFDNKDQYIIRRTEMFDFTKNDYSEKVNISKNVKIIYFTCTPYGDDIRKAYYLEKVEKT